jgi:hypothetical protein
MSFVMMFVHGGGAEADTDTKLETTPARALLRAASDDDRYQRQCSQDDRSNADLLHLLSPS